MTEYVLTSPTSDITNLIFSIVGIYMAHSLYKSQRKRWQTILAWVLVNIFFAVAAIILHMLFPAINYERISMCVGIFGILVYLYLFPHIPIAQRIFTYFLVDTCMNFVVLLPRTFSVWLAPQLGLHPDTLFAPLYVTVLVAFLIGFRLFFLPSILKALPIFKEKLISLTLFSATSYITMFLLVDPWGAFPSVSLYDISLYWGFMAIVTLGYILCFRTLGSILVSSETRHLSDTALLQAKITANEYYSMLENISQVRQIKHDISHHLFAISSLAKQEKHSEILTYLDDLSMMVPQVRVGTSNFITDSFLDYYEGLCKNSNIDFQSNITYSETNVYNQMQLGTFLGNSLKNAYEAALDVENNKRFVKIHGMQKGAQIIFHIENSYAKDPLPDYKSLKGDEHGYGLSSIRNVTEKCGGYLNISHENNVFLLHAVMIIDNPQQ